MDKFWLSGMEYFSAIKKEILPYLRMWMNLENISEITCSPKDKDCMSPLTWSSKLVKLIGAKNRMVVSRGLVGGEKMSCCSKGLRMQLCKLSKS